MNDSPIPTTLSIPSAPRRLEVLFGLACLLFLAGNLLAVWNGEAFWRHNPGYVDPFSSYYANPVIRALNHLTLALDVACCALAGWIVAQPDAKLPRRALMLLALLAAVLPWSELWYGTTFYYGEVRDKQALPVGIGNAGVLGSYVFCAYVLWRVSLPRAAARYPLVVRAAALVVVALAFWVALALLARPWRF
jgi:hypothetical protein